MFINKYACAMGSDAVFYAKEIAPRAVSDPGVGRVEAAGAQRGR